MTREKDEATGQRTRRTFMKVAGATTVALAGFSGVGAASGKDKKKKDKSKDKKKKDKKKRGKSARKHAPGRKKKK